MARFLIKLRGDTALAAAAGTSNLQPLFEDAPASALGFAAATPSWYVADLASAAENPWDSTHRELAGQLGIDDGKIVAAEPDLEQRIYFDPQQPAPEPLAITRTKECVQQPQATTHGRIAGPDKFAWHLADEFSQLGSARDAVQFTDPFRTRIAHIDTGYDRNHSAKPEKILTELERNFAGNGTGPDSAQDPNRKFLFDNSGHGTGTSGILAGGLVNSQYLGGAPQAEILPIRIADSVVLFSTSALAKALQYATAQGCDVVSMSMGGLPSGAWRDAVNAAYMAGVCMVAASGDCFGGAPTHNVVYPARYKRVIAACGVMANGEPYYGLPPLVIEGNWGPDSCMSAALSAYAPNIPWARYGCPAIVDLDGAGTSSSTPQIAAAAALWFEKYKKALPRDWRRVEAVRKALFDSAKTAGPNAAKLGKGILQAAAALKIAPDLALSITKEDNDSFSFFRVITGLGISDGGAREQMLNLELAQRWLVNSELAALVPDPDAPPSPDALKKFMEAVVADKGASLTLRKHVAARYMVVSDGGPVPGAPAEVVPQQRQACDAAVLVKAPAFRRIRTYAVDPSFSGQFETAHLNEVTLQVPWEKLKPGPSGEYISVVDVDATGHSYSPVNLDDPPLLAQDGFAPSEGNAGFHQQMVYAVAMTTVGHFETALGRPVLWRSKDGNFQHQLEIRPHALHQANAFYSPSEVALLFGYFQAAEDDAGDHVPGSMVYACLSHDIVAHETTHAILDGMHRRFNQPTNPDVLAFHEAFADIVALMQHFTIPEILEHEIGKTQGNLEAESMMGSLAVQFGRATGARGALRDAIGRYENGSWVRNYPDPLDYQKKLEPHGRGSLLVAAVFDAFLAIYRSRTADLLRIYTSGTGVLPGGAIHPDLVKRLARESATAAAHVLKLCIRALDYVPPVDITFGEYLRGIVTADSDLVPDDPLHYRVAFIEAFRKRGLYPQDLRTFSEATLRWQGVNFEVPPPMYKAMVKHLKRYANDCFYERGREKLFDKTAEHIGLLEKMLADSLAKDREFAKKLGLNPDLPVEVHELRRSLRTSPDGRTTPQIIVGLVQSKNIDVDGVSHTFLGGATVVVDLGTPEIQYVIHKSVDSETRQARTAAFLRANAQDSLRQLLLAPGGNPFVALHAGTQLT